MAFRTIVVNENGNRNVPYGNQNGKRWDASVLRRGGGYV